MLTEWITAVPALIVAAALVFVPGGVVVAALGARRMTAFALAAPVSLGIAAAAAIVLRPLGIGFTPLSFAAVTALAALVAVALRLWLYPRFLHLGDLTGSARSDPPSPARTLTIIAFTLGLAVPAGIIGFRYMRAMTTPDTVSQLFDNIFHLNAIRLISETHDGSSLVLGNLTEASQGFYPAAFHDLVALVSMGSGAGPAASIAVVTIVMAALVWPISCMFLAARLFGNRPLPLLLTGVLSAAFAAFPFQLVSYGVLFPFHAAVALIPLLLGLTLELFRQSRSPHTSPLAAASALVLVVPGVLLTHPSAVVAVLVLGSPFVLARVIEVVRTPGGLRPRVALRELSLPLIYVAVTITAVLKARPSLKDAPWYAWDTIGNATWSVFTSSPLGVPASWAIFVLLVTGIAIALRRFVRYWPLLALFAIAALLYVIGAAFPDSWFRNGMIGVWYRDTHRVAAFLVIATLPLAVLGAMGVVRLLGNLILRATKGRTKRPSEQVRANAILAVGLAVAVLLVPLTQREQMDTAEAQLASAYVAGPKAPILSDDERTLIERLHTEVPDADVIVGNPATGTAWAYALDGRKVLLPHIFGDRSPDEEYLLNHWDEAATDPRVCDLIRQHRAFWALDFGVRWPHGESSIMPGTDSVQTAPGIVEVDRVGEAALYRVTVCG